MAAQCIYFIAEKCSNLDSVLLKILCELVNDLLRPVLDEMLYGLCPLERVSIL
jgi:hypothetical protein